VRLLNRYVLRELAAPFAFALAALTSIMLLNQIAKRFGALVGKGLPWSVIAEVFLLSLPFIVAMTLPMAVLLAVLYAFSHLAAGNEITAMRAGGISVGQLLRPVFAAALVLSVLTFLFMDQLLPASNLRLKALVIDIGRKKPTFDLQEQAINEIPPSLFYLRAGRIDASGGRLRDVTIYDMSGQQSRRVIYADSGRMAFEEGQIDLNLRLWDGSIQSFKGADPTLFQLTYFRVNTIRVRNVANALERGGTEVSRSDREMSTCQMLAIVRDSNAAVRAARARSRELLERDLRNLLGLPPAAHVEVPDTPRRPLPAYCGWVERLGRLLLPETVEGQEPAQPPGRIAPRRRPDLPGPRKPALPDRLAPDPLRVPLGADTVRTATASHRLVALSAWADVANAGEQVRSATRGTNKFSVEIHKKWAISVAGMVFVLLGIPLALRFPRGGMGLVLGGGLGIFALYYVSLTAGEPLADAGKVPPAMMIWGPNVIFALLGVGGLLRVNRELGSTRGGDFAEIMDAIRRRTARWRRR
jgi:lipopolysaccharide export system permease protein